ncbi:hypothetical protein DFH09DRAFT_934387, partial [Mycena vulgaris]
NWLSSVTAGHTKRITVNAILLGKYCVGKLFNPAPSLIFLAVSLQRNHVPWIILSCCYASLLFLLLALRYYLAAENKRRDAEAVDDTYDNAYIR